MQLAEIDPLTLPSVAIDTRLLLPSVPFVYFCLNRSGEVLYIGKTLNLQNRWRRHNRITHLTNAGCVKIAWLEIAIELLDEVEVALIRRFDPPLNNHHAFLSKLLPTRSASPAILSVFYRLRSSRQASFDA